MHARSLLSTKDRSVTINVLQTCPSAHHARANSDELFLSKVGNSELLRLVDLIHREGAGQVAPRLLEQSYWHPNGFLKVVVRAFEDGSRLRLHYWPGLSERVVPLDEDIHTHRWNYWSLVLVGALRVETFIEAKSLGTAYFEITCSSNSNGTYTMSEPKQAILSQLSDRIIMAGSTHFGTISTLHRCARAASGPAITLFFQSAALCRASRIFRPTAPTERIETSSAPATCADIENMLNMIVSHEVKQ